MESSVIVTSLPLFEIIKPILCGCVHQVKCHCNTFAILLEYLNQSFVDIFTESNVTVTYLPLFWNNCTFLLWICPPSQMLLWMYPLSVQQYSQSYCWQVNCEPHWVHRIPNPTGIITFEYSQNDINIQYGNMSQYLQYMSNLFANLLNNDIQDTQLKIGMMCPQEDPHWVHRIPNPTGMIVFEYSYSK